MTTPAPALSNAVRAAISGAAGMPVGDAQTVTRSTAPAQVFSGSPSQGSQGLASALANANVRTAQAATEASVPLASAEAQSPTLANALRAAISSAAAPGVDTDVVTQALAAPAENSASPPPSTLPSDVAAFVASLPETAFTVTTGMNAAPQPATEFAPATAPWAPDPQPSPGPAPATVNIASALSVQTSAPGGGALLSPETSWQSACASANTDAPPANSVSSVASVAQPDLSALLQVGQAMAEPAAWPSSSAAPLQQPVATQNSLAVSQAISGWLASRGVTTPALAYSSSQSVPQAEPSVIIPQGSTAISQGISSWLAGRGIATPAYNAVSSQPVLPAQPTLPASQGATAISQGISSWLAGRGIATPAYNTVSSQPGFPAQPTTTVSQGATAISQGITSWLASRGVATPVSDASPLTTMQTVQSLPNVAPASGTGTSPQPAMESAAELLPLPSNASPQQANAATGSAWLAGRAAMQAPFAAPASANSAATPANPFSFLQTPQPQMPQASLGWPLAPATQSVSSPTPAVATAPGFANGPAQQNAVVSEPVLAEQRGASALAQIAAQLNAARSGMAPALTSSTQSAQQASAVTTGGVLPEPVVAAQKGQMALQQIAAQLPQSQAPAPTGATTNAPLPAPVPKASAQPSLPATGAQTAAKAASPATTAQSPQSAASQANSPQSPSQAAGQHTSTTQLASFAQSAEGAIKQHAGAASATEAQSLPLDPAKNGQNAAGQPSAPLSSATPQPSPPPSQPAHADATQIESAAHALQAAIGNGQASSDNPVSSVQPATLPENAVVAPTALTPTTSASSAVPDLHAAATNVPIPGPDADALAIAIAAKSAGGAHQFDIRLDPAQLGRVDVRLSMDNAGRAQAHLAAEKPETLAMLQRDQGLLVKSLKEQGIDLGGNGLQFSLKGQERQNGNRGTMRASRNAASLSGSSQTATGAAIAGLRPAGAGIDIRV
jgi:flagellar hook-length control protein FliK